MWSLGDKVLSNKELASHVFIGLGLIGFGWFDPTAFLDIKSSAPYDAPLYQSYVDTLYSLLGILPYATSFASCALIFQFKLKLNLENRVWSVISWEQKLKFLSLSIFLMSITIILGIALDDPVVSTAGAVSIPFAIIALIWPSHVRHLQRARFYPLFIFAMFLSPLAAIIPPYATAGALIYVAILMLGGMEKLDWSNAIELLPALVIIVMIPLTFSIADGIALGFLTYVSLKISSGEIRTVSYGAWFLTLIFISKFVFL